MNDAIQQGWRIEVKSEGFPDITDFYDGSKLETEILGYIVSKYGGSALRTGLTELRAIHYPSGTQVTCDFLGFLDSAKRIDFRYFPKERR